jgi:hypothetical protein
VRTRLKVNGADELITGGRDKRPVESPARGPRLDVDRRLGGNAVPFLGNGGEQQSERMSIASLRGSNLDRLGFHARMLADSPNPVG